MIVIMNANNSLYQAKLFSSWCFDLCQIPSLESTVNFSSKTGRRINSFFLLVVWVWQRPIRRDKNSFAWWTEY